MAAARRVLAIDFGSSNTAAAYRDGAGVIREVRLSSAGALMPSAVLYTADRVLVGRAAVQAALTRPDGFEPAPKRRLAEQEILLGSDLVATTDLVAAVVAEVYSRAVRVMGTDPVEVVMTHPDRWGPGLRQLLRDAAIKAGLAQDRIRLVSEATAAAWYYTATGVDLPVGARLAVFDFGAGTCDVAVLDKQADGSVAVIAADGVEGLGGQDLDARIHTWVARQLAVTDPTLAAELSDPGNIAGQLTLADRIRDAKEALSEASSASIVTSGAAGTHVLQLTREEFEALIAADVDRAVALTERVLGQANGVRHLTEPITLYLTGGSSTIPLVHTRLGALGAIGILGDPKTVVSQGALHTPTHTPPPPPPTPDPPPVTDLVLAGDALRRKIPSRAEPPPKPSPPPTARPTPRWRRKKIVIPAAVLLTIATIVIAVITATYDDGPAQVELPFTGLSGPQSVAVDDAGTVYITDTLNRRVLALARGSSTQQELPFTGLSGPQGVAVDDAGTVYVTDTATNRVLGLARGSSTQQELPFTDLSGPQGVAVDDAGTVYVTDTLNRRVLALARGSSTQRELPFTDLSGPQGVAVDDAGTVYVTDIGVVALARGSNAQQELPFTGRGGHQGVAIDDAGTVYVTDISDNNVSSLTRGSRTQQELPFTGIKFPTGVAVDGGGTVYVTDRTNNRVLALSTTTETTPRTTGTLPPPEPAPVPTATSSETSLSPTSGLLEIPGLPPITLPGYVPPEPAPSTAPN